MTKELTSKNLSLSIFRSVSFFPSLSRKDDLLAHYVSLVEIPKSQLYSRFYRQFSGKMTFENLYGATHRYHMSDRPSRKSMLQHAATRCNLLQHTAAHCSTHIATRRDTS